MNRSVCGLRFPIRGNHVFLIRQLIHNDFAARFKGSLAGSAWIVVHPLLMMAVYTIVFGVIYKSQAPGLSGETSVLDFAIFLFVGLVVFSFFSDIVGRSPTLVLSNPNYVKRVAFPLETLSIAIIGVGVIQLFIGLLIAIALILPIYKTISWSILLLPLIVASTLPGLIGISLILAAFGVYVRDTHHAITVIVSLLMFLSPLFYPASSLPAEFRWLIYLNPVSFPIEATRAVLLYQSIPSMLGITAYFIIGLAAALLGVKVFGKLRTGFADVI